MIILHFHLQPRFKYELFHIYFTSFYSSREDMNSINWLRSHVWLHSSVGRASHRYSQRSRVRISLKPWFFFFRLLPSNCLNWKSNYDDHSSLSSTTAVHIWIISYKPLIIFPLNRNVQLTRRRKTNRCWGAQGTETRKLYSVLSWLFEAPPKGRATKN